MPLPQTAPHPPGLLLFNQEGFSLSCSMEVSRQRTCCVLGRCWWMPTALDWTAETQAVLTSRWTGWVQLAASRGTSEPALTASFQRKPELNKLLWMNVTEPSPKYCSTLLTRQPLRKRVLFTEHSYISFVCPPALKQLPLSKPHVRWAKDVIRLD